MLLLSAGFLLGACSTKGHEEKMKTQKEAEDEFAATLTAADSSAVLTLCTQCMDLLKAKETRFPAHVPPRYPQSGLRRAGKR